MRPRKTLIRHVLVSFSGSHNYNLTGMTLSVLSFNRGGIETIDVGLSIDKPHYSEVKQ